MKTLGVVGLGFVGTAFWEGMSHAFNLMGYDKAKGWVECVGGPGHTVYRGTNWESGSIANVLLRTDGPIFVCVPTPMNEDGSCNTSIVENVVRELDKTNVGKSPRTVVIKSTVVPGTTERLNLDCHNLYVCFNPEFLREATAVEDFKNQDRIIIGGPHAGTAVLKRMYAQAYPDVPVTKTSSTIAEMVKYVTNAFLATKVAFANEIEQICRGLGIDYDKLIEYATKDKRLGNSHWSVPGPDGHRGFGLTCFPKDLNGLMALARKLGVEPKVLEGAWEKNLEVRPEKDWEAMKGRAVL